MNETQLVDIRRRIRELQSIPERDRTDAQWDELNELEIRTAPGNRESDRSSERRPPQARRTDSGQSTRRTSNAPFTGPRNNTRQEARPPQEPRADGAPRPPKRQHRRRRPTEVIGHS